MKIKPSKNKIMKQEELHSPEITLKLSNREIDILISAGLDLTKLKGDVLTISEIELGCLFKNYSKAIHPDLNENIDSEKLFKENYPVLKALRERARSDSNKVGIDLEESDNQNHPGKNTESYYEPGLDIASILNLYLNTLREVERQLRHEFDMSGKQYLEDLQKAEQRADSKISNIYDEMAGNKASVQAILDGIAVKNQALLDQEKNKKKYWLSKLFGNN